ncbi:hypothetical protein WAX88_15970 [Photobacterium damselae subsp. damselae]|uniref:hypothetical protein n=1 Tax=Photobacterium damselae TaxID=38293 RepID=UPI00311AC923
MTKDPFITQSTEYQEVPQLEGHSGGIQNQGYTTAIININTGSEGLGEFIIPAGGTLPLVVADGEKVLAKSQTGKEIILVGV